MGLLQAPADALGEKTPSTATPSCPVRAPQRCLSRSLGSQETALVTKALGDLICHLINFLHILLFNVCSFPSPEVFRSCFSLVLGVHSPLSVPGMRSCWTQTRAGPPSGPASCPSPCHVFWLHPSAAATQRGPVRGKRPRPSVCARVWVHACVHVCGCMLVCMRVGACSCACVWVHACVHACGCMHVCTV